VTLFRRKYPLYKYCVVALVTAGVAVFTLHHPTSSKKKGADGSSAWGLLLLGINLLFDGLTNSTQDHIYKSYRPYTGQQMMCALNSISTVLTSVYLLISPYIATTPIGAYLGMSAASGGELEYAINFIRRYPSVGWDIFAFAACGALGQMFICKSTLSSHEQDISEANVFSSLHSFDLRIAPLGHCHSDQKDAYHDLVGRLVRSSSQPNAVGWCWLGIRRCICRSTTLEAREARQRPSKEGGSQEVFLMTWHH
jgi:hypothetical protein